jgi:hypothetical protein
MYAYISLYTCVGGWVGACGWAGGQGGQVGGWDAAGGRGGRAGGQVGGWAGWMRQAGACVVVGLDAAVGRGGWAGGQVGGWGLAMLSKWTRTHPSHSSVAISGSSFCGSRAHRSKEGCLERSQHAMAKKKKKQSASMKSASIAAQRKARAWESATGFVGASFENAQVLAVEMIDEMLQVLATILPDLVPMGLQAFVNEHWASEIRARQKVNITTERRVSKNDLAPNGP